VENAASVIREADLQNGYRSSRRGGERMPQ